MKYDAMRWSSQLESACSTLSAHSEVEGDQVLVALARLAKVALEAGDIYRQVTDDSDTTVHPEFSIAPLKCSLNQTKNMLNPEQLQHSKPGTNRRHEHSAHVRCRLSNYLYICCRDCNLRAGSSTATDFAHALLRSQSEAD